MWQKFGRGVSVVVEVVGRVFLGEGGGEGRRGGREGGLGGG